MSGKTGIRVEVSACELFVAIAKYHQAKRLPPLNKMDGAWIEQADEHWWFAVNGHKLDVQVDGTNLPPFHALVTFNGWPAGCFSPHDGVICAGELANGREFISALEKAAGRLLGGAEHNEFPSGGS